MTTRRLTQLERDAIEQQEELAELDAIRVNNIRQNGLWVQSLKQYSDAELLHTWDKWFHSDEVSRPKTFLEWLQRDWGK